MIFTNATDPAKWCKVKLTHTGNPTTNGFITAEQHNRQIKEYDEGVLEVCHDRLLGEYL